jgi:hypothetical protein
MEPSPAPWLLLIVSLPTHSATARMRIWRALKTLGCCLLRDGTYLLPHTTAHQQSLRSLADETLREGGSAWLLDVQPQAADESDAYRTLFARDQEYAQLLATLAAARPTLAALTPQELGKLLRKLRREYEAVRAIDYFPNSSSAEAELAWNDFVQTAERLLAPDEPHAADAALVRLDAGDYQGRTWATRHRLWVDRVASAWLIRRFIDRQARFLWLESVAACPADALGFDFDGARFTHSGERVTFEVLLASFGLEQEAGLARLGALIHVLDGGSGFVAEASGFEAMLAGARERALDDDQLLAEISVVLDSLHAYFSAESSPPATLSKEQP